MKWLEPVEPMAESKWARVEKKVLDELDVDASRAPKKPRVTKWLVVAVVPVAAAAVFVLYAKTQHDTPGARIVTTDTTSRLEIDQSVLDIGPGSAATVTHETTGVVVKLERGRVECEVAPRKAGQSFVVLAGDVRVRVVGTHFAVARGVVDTSVDVERGTVEISSRSVVATLHAGDHWSTPPVVAATETPPPVMTTAEPVATEAPKVQATATASAELPPQREFEIASGLEKSDPDRATAMYEKLVKRGGSWGENALYAEGRLEIDRGRVAHGRQLLQSYVTQHPHGANVEDARALLARVPF